MSKFCGAHRAPRAGVDVIDAAPAALAVVALAMSSSSVAETIMLVLDDARRGRSLIVVDGTVDPDAVLEVVERLADSVAATGLTSAALVAASVRPGTGPLPGDADRWLEASEMAENVGVELIEWFVISDEIRPPVAWCPRDLLAEPPRWRGV